MPARPAGGDFYFCEAEKSVKILLHALGLDKHGLKKSVLIRLICVIRVLYRSKKEIDFYFQ